jgi:hypothetical protein
MDSAGLITQILMGCDLERITQTEGQGPLTQIAQMTQIKDVRAQS